MIRTLLVINVRGAGIADKLITYKMMALLIIGTRKSLTLVTVHLASPSQQGDSFLHAQRHI
ncbi:MAG: hypothetical protein CL912_11685 [Deltaproteobacteria bacterium]|nr:hypothetical protein [Deltaproteobacteria bacterium]